MEWFLPMSSFHTSSALLQNGFLSVNTANTPYDENNGWCSLVNTTTTAKTFVWTTSTDVGNTGTWASEALHFSAPVVAALDDGDFHPQTIPPFDPVVTVWQ